MAELETLLIGAVVYDVTFAADVKQHRDDGTYKNLHGEVDFAALEIRVEDTQNEQMKRVTVLHEAIHAILNGAGYFEHPEELITALGFGLYDLLKNNSDLLAWLDVQKHSARLAGEMAEVERIQRRIDRVRGPLNR